MTGFARPELLLWLWALPLAASLLVLAYWRRSRASKRFVAPGLLPRMAPGRSASRALVRGALLLVGGGLTIVAAAGPRGEPVPTDVARQGRDVCFIVDVSRSMRAQDVSPDRLERAKLWIYDVLSGLRGDRVAIVGMAGRPELTCPLTHDYRFARLALAGLDPELAPIGGTNLGDAVRMVLDDVFVEEEADQARFRDIIMITDGEDTADSLPLEAAAAASDRGIRLIIIGIGDERGARIPIVDGRGRVRDYVRDRSGNEVVARLDAETLASMARATEGGVFINAGTDELDLDSVYRELVARAERRQLDEATGVTYEEWFQVFALAAFALLACESLVSERSRRRA